MPYFDEPEGIWLTTDAEETYQAHKGNVLTREQQSRGGRAPCPPGNMHSEAYLRLQNTYRGLKSAHKRWGTPPPPPWPTFRQSRA